MKPPPSPPKPPARIDLHELKLQMEKQMGPERARRYFSYLGRLLSQRLSNLEFERLCLSTIGRENIQLHNRLVRSILKNAVQAKNPPLPPLVIDKIAPKPVQLPPIWSNGDLLPASPRRSRSSVRDRRFKDRPSPLGPNGRIDVATQPTHQPHNASVVSVNNGLNPCDRTAEQPAKRPRVSVHRMEDGEELGLRDALSFARGSLRAPLGIPFCSASIGGGRRSLPIPATVSDGAVAVAGNYDIGYLQGTQGLRKQIESRAEALGLGVPMDVVDLLNNGVDAYLKRLIGSCFQLVRSRSGHEPIKYPVKSLEPQRKPSIQGTLQDFKVAMELKPQQLGESWPLLLEKICLSSYEE